MLEFEYTLLGSTCNWNSVLVLVLVLLNLASTCTCTCTCHLSTCTCTCTLCTCDITAYLSYLSFLQPAYTCEMKRVEYTQMSTMVYYTSSAKCLHVSGKTVSCTHTISNFYHRLDIWFLMSLRFDHHSALKRGKIRPPFRSHVEIKTRPVAFVIPPTATQEIGAVFANL